MTLIRSRDTTRSAKKKPKTNRPAESNLNLPTDSDSVSTDGASYNPLIWQTTGRCGHCLMPIEARNHGAEVRHVETKIPYAECPKRSTVLSQTEGE